MYTPNKEMYDKTTPDWTYSAQSVNKKNWIYASPLVDSNGTIYVCTSLVSLSIHVGKVCETHHLS